ncbi:NADH-quinone oxidoreductase subunit L [bacterium]|nr:NADH-quinone oxidoreductase subunit L [bacterium]
MFNLLWLVPVLPLVGFLILTFAGKRLSRAAAGAVSVGAAAASAVIALLIAIAFMTSPPPDHHFTQTLWTWMSVGNFAPDFAFYLDPLSVVFMLVVTFVGTLIHIYSTEYMEKDADFPRFMSYLNLFVFAMLCLVLGDNLLLLYLGWEGVGLCSYLLIGFWYKDKQNGYCARKAFVVTRIGDTPMAIGLFLLFWSLGTVNIQELMGRATDTWSVGHPMAIAAALLLLGGACGKSAQVPLQTWLPDAMAGPTPVSALIHAATMVTAGVYLIARTHVIFELAPPAMTAVAIVGLVTLLISGFTALVQTDIKRVLAYSTVSQIGYMFLGLGVGAFSASIFHFMTHAFFKALLFLGAGAVIHALHEEQDLRKMGGLKNSLKTTYLTFLAGSAALAGFPLVSSGFYSKDLILYKAFTSGHVVMYALGAFGAFMTAVYTFRLVFLAFFGEEKTHVHHPPGKRITYPLIILAVLSIVGGFVELPATLGNVPAFSHFLEPTLPVHHGEHHVGTELVLQIVAAVISLSGIALAYFLWVKRPDIPAALAAKPWGETLRRFWFSGWGFDAVYNALIVRPVMGFAKFNRNDFVDAAYSGMAVVARAAHGLIRHTQTGRVRWYASGVVFGAVLLVAIVVVL